MDREKVIKGLEECASRGGWSHCPECMYKGTSPILICRGHIEAILALLKEQESKPIEYKACADAMLKMWMEDIVTDGEYNKIMDKLNRAHILKKI